MDIKKDYYFNRLKVKHIMTENIYEFLSRVLGTTANMDIDMNMNRDTSMDTDIDKDTDKNQDMDTDMDISINTDLDVATIHGHRHHAMTHAQDT
jgi:hypothetical protein